MSVEGDIRHRLARILLRASIAHQVRALRERNGWSRADFAKRCGAPVRAIADVENPAGKRWPTVDLLTDIANACNVGLLIRFASFDDWLAQIEASWDAPTPIVPVSP